MKTHGSEFVVLAALILLGADTSRAQPAASPTSFNFAYQVNSTTMPTLGKLTATLPKSLSTGYTLTASVSPPMNWLTVTPGGGTSPLALTVTVNPTSLSPGSYTGVITLGTNPGNTSAATHELEQIPGRPRAYNSDYLELCSHYDLTPLTINVSCPHEQGDVESQNRHLKRRLKQHLILRGSRDFAAVEDYD